MVLLTGFIVLLGLFSVTSSVAAAQQLLQSNHKSSSNTPLRFDDGSTGLFTPSNPFLCESPTALRRCSTLSFRDIALGSRWAISVILLSRPCRVLADTGAKFHPESWNTNAKIFIVDQPIGFGFSYTDYGENTWSVVITYQL
ncbi:hypothetical protein K435DRAFT_809215 [Dendrothele bispora CBS 962.96]|uniref:Uncharacterized protein n=1 Tax=Dendrothele bispora (strain CBS 962.96) TaxID=1314807 RepID=A0A4S8KZ00_DENBC|nr:hypothetical protein K435DRAFT_809215 [Dendrothele bispora CBS 962.96]